MSSQRGFTLIEILIALSLGALVVLSLFRTLTLALETQEEAQRQIRAHQHARDVADWIVQLVQSASDVRALGPHSLELAGVFELTRGTECVGLLLRRVATAGPTVALYERRKAACPEDADSTGGEISLVSDPVTSIVRLEFSALNRELLPTSDLKTARVVRVALGLDVNGDADADYVVTQRAVPRGR